MFGTNEKISEDMEIYLDRQRHVPYIVEASSSLNLWTIVEQKVQGKTNNKLT